VYFIPLKTTLTHIKLHQRIVDFMSNSTKKITLLRISYKSLRLTHIRLPKILLKRIPIHLIISINNWIACKSNFLILIFISLFPRYGFCTFRNIILIIVVVVSSTVSSFLTIFFLINSFFILILFTIIIVVIISYLLLFINRILSNFWHVL